jgi:hypothetical protein
VTYAIRFDFPEADFPMFAGPYKGAAGFAPTLRSAWLYDDADVAARVLANSYGPNLSKFGRVFTVRERVPA